LIATWFLVGEFTARPLLKSYVEGKNPIESTEEESETSRESSSEKSVSEEAEENRKEGGPPLDWTYLNFNLPDVFSLSMPEILIKENISQFDIVKAFFPPFYLQYCAWIE